ncbi:hypothetical protein [Microbacterium sp.]|uniref:hypothetical protein n=1 Tax=Microbacterium sp. TaxID=51671 RepID=UPI002E2F0130|nr:hypothetical protein [Microbacterium sp.]HEX5728420.1 hypothetical protein [Microbacterium sp.]
MIFSHYVVIDGERYFVPGEHGIDALRQEILDAVQAGGAYVALARAGVGYTEVLVTATTPVRIEHIAAEPSPTMATGEYADDVDPGWWV